MSAVRQRLFLPIILLIAVAAVSTASILIRLAQQHASSISIAALRLTIATLVLAPIALTRRRAELKTLQAGQVRLAVLSGVCLAIHFASWITSLEFTSVAISVVLVSTGPIWVAVLSPLFLKERLSRAALIGLALAVLGGFIVGGSGACTWKPGLSCTTFAQLPAGGALWGSFLALVGAWAVSGYLMIGRQLRQSISLIPYVFLVYGCAAIFLLTALVISGGTPFGLPPITYLWIALLALGPQLIGHSAYNWALGALPASFVAVTTLGEPIGSAILAYMILREKPGLLVILGGVVILAGIYVASTSALRAERTASVALLR